MSKWFCLVDGKESGPIELAELKCFAHSAGGLKPRDKVRRADRADWSQAKEVKGLLSACQSPASPSRTAQRYAHPLVKYMLRPL